MPFRFGVVTLTEAPQAFARVAHPAADGRASRRRVGRTAGAQVVRQEPGAEQRGQLRPVRAPRWHRARGCTSAGDAATAFGHFAAALPGRRSSAAAARGLNALVANYGPALIDRAVLDALCRALGRPFHDVIRAQPGRHRRRPICAPTCADSTSTVSSRGLQPRRNASARATPSGWWTRSPRRDQDRTGRRRPARDAGGGRRGLRPPLVQAQGRRRRARRTSTGSARIAARARPHRRRLPRHPRRQRAVRRTSRACWNCGSGSRPSRRSRRLCGSVVVHRAADQARRRRCRQDVSATVGAEAGDHRRVRRLASTPSSAARDTGLHRRLVQDLQGLLQVARSTARAASSGTRGGRRRGVDPTAALPDERRGPDDPGRARRCSRTWRWCR